ncbi:MAG: hypothetical protein ACYDBQ_09785 [Thermoplasmatota archaeon]
MDSSSIAFIVTAAAAVVQSAVAILLYLNNRNLARIAREDHISRKPIFRVHFNGIRSRPRDPSRDMCAFMFTVENQGARDSVIGNWDLAATAVDGQSRSVYLPFYPIESYPSHDFGRLPGRVNPAERHLIKSGDARRFIGVLPANSGYQGWNRIRLVVHPVGGTAGTCEVPWAEEFSNASGGRAPDARPARILAG